MKFAKIYWIAYVIVLAGLFLGFEFKSSLIEVAKAVLRSPQQQPIKQQAPSLPPAPKARTVIGTIRTATPNARVQLEIRNGIRRW